MIVKEIMRVYFVSIREILIVFERVSHRPAGIDGVRGYSR